MRKTWSILAVGVMAAALMTSCGNSNVESTETTTVAETTQETTEFTITDYSNYVSLGQYKGLEVEPIVVSDEEIDERIEMYFHDVVREGDTVNIDYAGYKNGEAFEGGTADGQSLTIGSGQFIEGFEEGLVGVKTGETVDLNLTFPENYPATELAGQAVVFTVTVNSITTTLGPEYTLDYVKANTDCTTLEEFEQRVHDEIYAEYNEVRMSNVWSETLNNATISGYPQEEVDRYATEMEDYYKQMATAYGMDTESFLSAYGYTMDSFKEECQTYGKSVMEETMVLYMIANAEGMEVTDEEYRAEIDTVIEQSGMTEESILEYYGGESYIRQSLLFSEVVEFLAANAVEK